MELIDFFDLHTKRFNPSLVTLGMFDGVHVGHQQLLTTAVKQAKHQGLDPILVTMADFPQKTLGQPVPAKIIPDEERIARLAEFGFSYGVIINFDKHVAQITAQDFLRHHLITQLQMRSLVVGYSARFGAGGQGDIHFLQTHEQPYHYRLLVVPPQQLANGQAVSSSRIRQAVVEGDIAMAADMLGRPYTLYGTVMSGAKRGKQLGFPTANLALQHDLLPPLGVYGGRTVIDNASYKCVINIGAQPTFGDNTPLTVEAHVINFNGDLYNQDMAVSIEKYLRPQQRFEEVEDLKIQIQNDIETWLTS